MKRNSLLLSVFCLVVLAWACNKPTMVGSDLFEGEYADVVVSDTFTLTAASIIPSTNVEAYRPGTPFTYLMVGDFTDAQFGRTQAEIYAQYYLSTNVIPDFANATLDSMVLVLEYQSNGSYGDTIGNYSFAVHEITEAVSDSTTIYTSQTYDYSDLPVGEISFQVNFKDSITVFEPTNDSIIQLKVAPQLRIKLNEAFGQQILSLDTSYYSSKKSEFQDKFKGLVVKAAGAQPGIIAFDMNEVNSKLRMYYHFPEGYVRVFDYDTYSEDLRFTSITNDNTGSVSAAAIANPESSDYLHLQGLVGPDLKIELPTLVNLKGKAAVHKAELEFYGLDSIGLWQPTTQVLAATLVTNDTTTLTDDSYSAAINNLFDVVRGQPEPVVIDGQKLYKYVINFTTHAQSMVDGTAASTLYLTKFLRMQSARRVVLFGPKHPKYPAKARIYYTNF